MTSRWPRSTLDARSTTLSTHTGENQNFLRHFSGTKVPNGFNLQNLCDNFPRFWSQRGSISTSQEALPVKPAQVARASHSALIPSLIFSSPLSICSSQRWRSSRAGRGPSTERPLPASGHERQHQVARSNKITNLTFYEEKNPVFAVFLSTFPPSACLARTSSPWSKTRKLFTSMEQVAQDKPIPLPLPIIDAYIREEVLLKNLKLEQNAIERSASISTSAASGHQQHQRISSIHASLHQQHQCISASAASAHQQHQCISSIRR